MSDTSSPSSSWSHEYVSSISSASGTLSRAQEDMKSNSPTNLHVHDYFEKDYDDGEGSHFESNMLTYNMKLLGSELASVRQSLSNQSLSSPCGSISSANVTSLEDGSSSPDDESFKGAQNVAEKSYSEDFSCEEEEEEEEEEELEEDDDEEVEGSTTTESADYTYTQSTASTKRTTFITEIPHDTAYDSSSMSLIKAIQDRDVNSLKRLIENGGNIDDARDQYMRSPLHVACSLGHVVMVEYLINVGCNVDAPSMQKQTPLMEACIGGHVDIVKLLIPEVVDIDIGDEQGRSATHYCALNGEVECLELLCENGSDVCIEDKLNRTGIHFAAMKNHSAIIQCLMDRGAELEAVDLDGKSPAHYAARYGSIDCLNLLLRSAIDIKQSDKDGILASHEAAYHDKLACLKVILKKGQVDIAAVDKKGRNILHKAAQGNAMSCLHWILNTGKLKPDTTDDSYNTALHYSAADGHPSAFHCLLQHGANLNHMNYDGETPLDVAKKSGKLQTINKAIEGVIKCKQCNKTMQAQRNKVTLQSKDLFSYTAQCQQLSPISSRQGKHSQVTKNVKSKISPSHNSLLAAKYYGPIQ
jgi:ankyrin repeat protein